MNERLRLAVFFLFKVPVGVVGIAGVYGFIAASMMARVYMGLDRAIETIVPVSMMTATFIFAFTIFLWYDEVGKSKFSAWEWKK